jgi:peptide-methionine (R)-S-oxide reductase
MKQRMTRSIGLCAATLMAVAWTIAGCGRNADQQASGERAPAAATTMAGSAGPATRPAELLYLDPQPAVVKKVTIADDVWQRILTPEQFEVTRQAGTEPPYQNAYFENHARGEYYCVNCGLLLFRSDDKYDSGTGWPSFTRPVEQRYVEQVSDTSLGDDRTEIRCARCGAHLGHVFPDGPAPTGLRYCMNSAALVFKPSK